MIGGLADQVFNFTSCSDGQGFTLIAGHDSSSCWRPRKCTAFCGLWQCQVGAMEALFEQCPSMVLAPGNRHSGQYGLPGMLAGQVLSTTCGNDENRTRYLLVRLGPMAQDCRKTVSTLLALLIEGGRLDNILERPQHLSSLLLDVPGTFWMFPSPALNYLWQIYDSTDLSWKDRTSRSVAPSGR